MEAIMQEMAVTDTSATSRIGGPQDRKIGQSRMCHTLFRDSGNKASIRVPRMFHSHV
jgi:hypothetical protein